MNRYSIYYRLSYKSAITAIDNRKALYSHDLRLWLLFASYFRHILDICPWFQQPLLNVVRRILFLWSHACLVPTPIVLVDNDAVIAAESSWDSKKNYMYVNQLIGDDHRRPWTNTTSDELRFCCLWESC